MRPAFAVLVVLAVAIMVTVGVLAVRHPVSCQSEYNTLRDRLAAYSVTFDRDLLRHLPACR